MKKHAVQKPLVCSGHSRPVPYVAYSATDAENNFFMISGCLDGKAMLRIGNTGDWIGTFLGHKGAVWSAELNADASKAVTGSADYTAKVWNAHTGAEEVSFEHKKIVKCVDFSPNGSRIVTGGMESLIRLFDLEKPDAEPQVLKGHDGMIRRTLWTGDNTLFTAGADGVVRLWDLRQSKVAHKAMLGADIRDVTLSVGHTNDADVMLSATAGRSVSFLKMSDLSIVKQHKVKFELNTACYNAKLNRFLAAGGDFWAKVFDYESGELLETHKGHHGPLHCMRIAPDLATYCSASEDGTIRLWQSEIKNYGLWVLNENVKNTNANAAKKPSTATDAKIASANEE